jgi:hypothetical protein
LNAGGAAACENCGTDLRVICPGCGQINGIGAERCMECDRELDPLAHAFRPMSASFEMRRQEMLRRAPALRREAERESQARLDILREADRRRMQRAAEAVDSAKRRERRIVLAAGIAAAVFAAIAILALVLTR